MKTTGSPAAEATARFLAHPAPKPVVDCVVFRYTGERLELLLCRRAIEPFAGSWALPGGAVRLGEAPADAARRKLLTEGGLSDVFIEQLFTFGEPGRDPRGHVISIAHYALVRAGEPAAPVAAEAREARWWPADGLPPLAFDHAGIVGVARERLRTKVRWAPVGFELLGDAFTLLELQRLYEAVLGRALDKANFRRDILKTGVLAACGHRHEPPRGRPARFYRFDRERYAAATERGFRFEL